MSTQTPAGIASRAGPPQSPRGPSCGLTVRIRIELSIEASASAPDAPREEAGPTGDDEPGPPPIKVFPASVRRWIEAGRPWPHGWLGLDDVGCFL